MENKTNHLINETSPYLLQHAHNPVDWYPWGEAAFNKARDENKPVLVSIGYAACHWCHVMAHESFEDARTAERMNSLYVCIKVDREERPDVDQIYMQYVQMTTGNGGWPLNVFLTADQVPFYAGTYFPPVDRFGRPSWQKILESVSHFYHKNKTELHKNTQIIRSEFSKINQLPPNGELPDLSIMEETGERLKRYYDKENGGLGGAPKFPAVHPLAFFLRLYRNTGQKSYLEMVTRSLKKMGQGGIYDQIGGGFARYSVDARWQIPHFEKMLYDNAQLVPLFLDTFLVTADPCFLEIVRDTLAFVSRELLSPQGGFYSSLDADSEGVEGKYYIWDQEEIMHFLGPHAGPVFCSYYGVTSAGNFEGKNILHGGKDVAEVATQFGLSVSAVENILKESKDKLLLIREKRVKPGLDDKILTSWNGLMLSAFARACPVLNDVSYEHIIRRNIDFLKDHLYLKNHLQRTYSRGKALYHGYLDDYAFLIQGVLDAYEALFDIRYLEWAEQLMKETDLYFSDGIKGGYFYTSSRQEKLFERMRDSHDQSIPSGTGIMLMNHLRFYALTGGSDHLERAEAIIKIHSGAIRQNPYAHASYLAGIDFYLQTAKEIVLMIPENTDPQLFRQAVFATYQPNRIVVPFFADSDPSPLISAHREGKSFMDKKITAYVCHRFTCSPPVMNPADLADLIR